MTTAFALTMPKSDRWASAAREQADRDGCRGLPGAHAKCASIANERAARVRLTTRALSISSRSLRSKRLADALFTAVGRSRSRAKCSQPHALRVFGDYPSGEIDHRDRRPSTQLPTTLTADVRGHVRMSRGNSLGATLAVAGDVGVDDTCCSPRPDHDLDLAPVSPWMSAALRREEVLRAARIEFGLGATRGEVVVHRVVYRGRARRLAVHRASIRPPHPVRWSSAALSTAVAPGDVTVHQIVDPAAVGCSSAGLSTRLPCPAKSSSTG